VKTALFDILRPQLEGMKVLDVFAGSGGVGIEALSQGAGHCTFIDINNNAFKTIKKNLESTKLSDHASVLNTDAFSFLRRTKESFDLIYVAPPQYEGLWVETLHILAERPELLRKDGMVVVQIDPKEYETLSLQSFVETSQRKYGNTVLIFFGKTG
jgi:16S rRNA (guanine(966)-N(2))-methyltransferase RsmD